jgi:hypothetical protein
MTSETREIEVTIAVRVYVPLRLTVRVDLDTLRDCGAISDAAEMRHVEMPHCNSVSADEVWSAFDSEEQFSEFDDAVTAALKADGVDVEALRAEPGQEG